MKTSPRRVLAALMFAGLLAGCAAIAPQTPFERGVAAFQAEEYAQAAAAWRASVESGSADAPAARNGLGWLYEHGLGVDRDIARAVAHYTAAAGAGHPRGQFNLGRLYDAGEGVAENDRVAARLYERAAAAGNAEAQNHIGRMYRAGDGVAADAERAAMWLERSAQQGYASAQNLLGLMYLRGEGVESDPVEAYFWTALAARRGAVGAELNRAFLHPFLSDETRAAVEDRLARWEPTPE